VPGLTALGGAAYGARYAGIGAEKAELRNLLDDAAATLERANQERGAAYVCCIRDGVDTSPQGHEALSAFRGELSQAAQIRGKLVMRTAESAAVSVYYLNALLALGRVSTEIGVVHMTPADQAQNFNMQRTNQKLEAGEQDFNSEYADFLAAAQRYMRPGEDPGSGPGAGLSGSGGSPPGPGPRGAPVTSGRVVRRR
jgi:hypothetical protein